jgi:GT2 family glycosyltransferase
MTQVANRVYIVILNWNGWRDTLECLESVFRMEYDDFRVVVCDNASGDGSPERILQWAEGIENAIVSNETVWGSFTPILKPVLAAHFRLQAGDQILISGDPSSQLSLIETGKNMGFAGGCNVGIRYALQDPACAYVWVLNNDTVVHKDALSELVNYSAAYPRVGITGSTIFYYHSSDQVQAYGGTRYSAWMSRTPPSTEADRKSGIRLDCILGCSMLVTRSFLEQIGLMCEDYFLYFEELDWAARSKHEFLLGYAPESKVYHKEGASIGSSREREQRSLLSERFLSRNRVVYTRRHHPWLVPSVLFWVFAAAFFRLLKGDLPRARTIIVSAIEGLRVKLGGID